MKAGTFFVLGPEERRDHLQQQARVHAAAIVELLSTSPATDADCEAVRRQLIGLSTALGSLEQQLLAMTDSSREARAAAKRRMERAS